MLQDDVLRGEIVELCLKFGMGRPGVGSECMIVTAFEDLRESLDGMRDLDDEVNKLYSKLRQTRKERAAAKSRFVKKLNVYKRMYNPELFLEFKEIVGKAVELANEGFFAKSPSLNWILKQMERLSDRCVSLIRSEKGTKDKSCRKKRKMIQRVGVPDMLREKWRCDTLTGKTFEKKEEFFPVWSKEKPGEIEVRSREGMSDTRIIKVYNPEYSPSPVVQYVRSCM